MNQKKEKQIAMPHGGFVKVWSNEVQFTVGMPHGTEYREVDVNIFEILAYNARIDWPLGMTRQNIEFVRELAKKYNRNMILELAVFGMESIA